MNELVERRVELITNALLHLPIRGAELQFAARQVELALRPDEEARISELQADLGLDAKALAAAIERLDDLAGRRNVPSVLTRSGRQFIAEKVISAYLAAAGRAALTEQS